MGIDINAYRCRVGLFSLHHSTGVLMSPFNLTFSVLVKLLGSVSFIRILLLMAGIEQNPGPTDQFIFRYQYLLIEVGTKILRQLFDNQVGNDINNYLNMNPQQDKQLKFLVKMDIINDDQKKVLPPIDKNPNSANFDITLLCCLLRNICGLSKPTDVVWEIPVTPGNSSLEADITRLRECRNNLAHIETVFVNKKEFDIEWNELSLILFRLNRKAGINDLATLISDVQDRAIDEKLKEEFDYFLKSWNEMDKMFDHGNEVVMKEVTNVKCAVSEVKSDTEKIQESLSEVKSNTGKMLDILTGQGDNQARNENAHTPEIKGMKLQNIHSQQNQRVDEPSDMQRVLIGFYKRHYKNLSVLPVFDKKDADSLLLYESPSMHSVDETENTKEIRCYGDVFSKNNTSCNEIYIIGHAGVGKTLFCEHLCLMWCNAMSDLQIKEEYEYVSKFGYVFYISLRDTEHNHVIDMIKESYFEHYDTKDILKIIQSKTNCLIILDGLDEWNQKEDGKKTLELPNVGKRTHDLPKRLNLDNCIYLTTSRPYRIELVRLSRKDVDHQIYISGIHEKSINSYIENIINYMNEKKSTDRKSSDFESEIKKFGLTDEIRIPIIASHLVVLWQEKKLEGMTKTLVFANILEMLFERAKHRGVRFPPSTTPVRQLPDSLSGLVYSNEYVNLLYKVNRLLLCSKSEQDEKVEQLICSRHQLHSKPYYFSDEEIEFLCKIGILSTNEVFECFLVETIELHFIHTKFRQFFAELFASSKDTKNSFTDVIIRLKSLNVIKFFHYFLDFFE